MAEVYHYRIQEDANNQPTAAQNYQVGGATIGFRTFVSEVADGDDVVILAEEVDGDGNPAGAWEICTATYETSTTPDELQSRTLIKSSSGSLIDWSAGGENATPRLSVINKPTGARRLFAAGVFASETNLTFDGFVAGKDYVISIVGARLGTDGVTLVAEANDGGWVTTSDYQTFDITSQATNEALTASSSTNWTWPTTGIAFGNDNTAGEEERVSLWVQLYDPAEADGETHFDGTYGGHFNTTGANVLGWIQGHLEDARSVTGFRIRPSSGNWGTDGRYECWEYDRA